MEIIADCIAEAHEKIVDAIIEEGAFQSIETEPGKFMNTWELTDPLMLIVRHPNEGQLSSDACEFGEKFIAQYKQDMITVQNRGFKYEYPARLFDYPKRKETNGRVWHIGGGDRLGYNQIAEIIEKLTESPTNRRALAITWVPEIDGDAVEPPCLQFTHFLIRRGVVDHGQDPNVWYLSGRFPFRSHDMLSGYPANAIGLLGLMQYVATQVQENIFAEIRIGSLITWSSSAHIYCDAQSKLLSTFTGLIAKKKMSKTWWSEKK
jgi:thymidylate synthase